MSYADFYEGSRVLQSQKCNPNDVVQCDGGFEVGGMDDTLSINPELTCAQACDGKCCVGTNACEQFTGSICKDGISCIGENACFSANITSVLRSCNGRSACHNAGQLGYPGRVIDSCQGNVTGNDYKTICQSAAQSGFIGEIINSCNGYNGQGGRACLEVAKDYGYVKSIVNSCQGRRACSKAAISGSIEGGIINSCVGDSPCRETAYNHGSIAGIFQSCYGKFACRDVASSKGVDDDYSDVAGSSIGGTGIFKACKGNEACFGLAKTNAADPVTYYDIPSGVKLCCNEDTLCKDIKTLDDLPPDCIMPKNEKSNKPWGGDRE